MQTTCSQTVCQKKAKKPWARTRGVPEGLQQVDVRRRRQVEPHAARLEAHQQHSGRTRLQAGKVAQQLHTTMVAPC